MESKFLKPFVNRETGAVTAAPRALRYRELIAMLTAKHLLPAIYSHRSYAVGRGLISYGPEILDQFRRAASYVDRFLKGENPADERCFCAARQSWATCRQLLVNLLLASRPKLDFGRVNGGFWRIVLKNSVLKRSVIADSFRSVGAGDRIDDGSAAG